MTSSQQKRKPKGLENIPSIAILSWLRGTSFISVLITVIATISNNFTLSVVFGFSALLLILLDLWNEQLALGWKVIISTIVFASGTYIGSEVFKKAPVTISAQVITTPHIKGDTYGGINWYDYRASDLRVWITNESSLDYAHLDFTIDTNAHILAAGQLQKLPKCDISLANEPQATINFKQNLDKENSLNPPISSTLGVGYRLACSELPRNSSVQLIFAVTDKPNPSGISIAVVATPNNGATNPPTEVIVNGTYQVGFRVKHVIQKSKIDVRK